MKINNHLLIGESDDTVEFKRSPNQSNLISPLYLVVHFTVGTTLDGVVNWFLNPDAKASAHLIIDRNGHIVQMVAFNKKAWHAGKSSWGNLDGINQYSIGIELVNAGKLRKNANGQWVNWANNSIPDNEVTVAKHRIETEPTGWHEYPEAQIHSAIQVASLLNRKYQFTDVLGHEDISPGRKVDPGPLFPLNSFRSKVLGRQ